MVKEPGNKVGGVEKLPLVACAPPGAPLPGVNWHEVLLVADHAMVEVRLSEIVGGFAVRTIEGRGSAAAAATVTVVVCCAVAKRALEHIKV